MLQQVEEYFCASSWVKDEHLGLLLSGRLSNTAGIIPWNASTIGPVARALTGLAREVARAAQVNYVFVANPLDWCSQKPAAIACQFIDPNHSVAVKLGNPRWIGLDSSLFDASLEEWFADKCVPRLDARLLEELAHVWDYRLQEQSSPYSSKSQKWRSANEGRFDVSNRWLYSDIEYQSAEDWALAVQWYVFNPDTLVQVSPERHTFVGELFRRWLL